MIAVVKVGGATSGAAAQVAALGRAGRQVVVVHGAGPKITARLHRGRTGAALR